MAVYTLRSLALERFALLSRLYSLEQVFMAFVVLVWSRQTTALTV